MSSSLNQTRVVAIHDRALAVARKYRACEVELIEALQEVEKFKVYLHHGCSSSFKYACDILGLSEDVAYMFINVSRKARQIPQLADDLKAGKITVSKAKRIAPILNDENQKELLSFAAGATKREIEKLVAQVDPKLTIHDKLSFSADPVDRVSIRNQMTKKARVQLQVGLAENVMLMIRQAQDIISQQKQSSVDLEEVFTEVFEDWIKRKDPVERAKRSKLKGERKDHSTVKSDQMAGSPKSTAAVSEAHATQPLPKLGPGPVPEKPALGDVEPTRQYKSLANLRKPLAAKQKHEVFLKYKGRCSFEKDGRSCGQRRFLQIHHKIPVSIGGTNDPDNLVLLCSGHHRMEHLNEHEPH